MTEFERVWGIVRDMYLGRSERPDRWREFMFYVDSFGRDMARHDTRRRRPQPVAPTGQTQHHGEGGA
jgi:hypothetical protein